MPLGAGISAARNMDLDVRGVGSLASGGTRESGRARLTNASDPVTAQGATHLAILHRVTRVGTVAVHQLTMCAFLYPPATRITLNRRRLWRS